MIPREGRLWNFGGTHKIYKRFLTDRCLTHIRLGDAAHSESRHYIDIFGIIRCWRRTRYFKERERERAYSLCDSISVGFNTHHSIYTIVHAVRGVMCVCACASMCAISNCRTECHTRDHPLRRHMTAICFFKKCYRNELRTLSFRVSLCNALRRTHSLRCSYSLRDAHECFQEF